MVKLYPDGSMEHMLHNKMSRLQKEQSFEILTFPRPRSLIPPIERGE